MKKTDWKMASNSQLVDKLKSLNEEFEEKKEQMLSLHKEMTKISEEYEEVNNILNKRQGKKND